jgi:hypothetical protein
MSKKKKTKELNFCDHLFEAIKILETAIMKGPYNDREMEELKYALDLLTQADHIVWLTASEHDEKEDPLGPIERADDDKWADIYARL